MDERVPNLSILALDLEGTLISNAVSQIPRPGLFHFLEQCRMLFPRIVMFTTVSEPRFRTIAHLLVEEGCAPSWFAQLDNVVWMGKTKDLGLISGASPSECLLVDDFEGYVHPEQHSHWVQIECFAFPYDDSDSGLTQTLEKIKQRLAGPHC